MSENNKKSGIKVNGYSNVKLNAKRDKKRAEAEIRQNKWKKLTKEEKIQIILSRRGNSSKERKKYQIK